MTIHLHKHKGSPLLVANSIAFGATLGGMTSPFLKAAKVSTEKVVEAIELVKKQAEVTFFSAGASLMNKNKEISFDFSREIISIRD